MMVEIYTDGSCLGNPGPGGFGYIIKYVGNSGRIYQISGGQGYLNTTNNRMELRALIAALQRLNQPCEVRLFSDSKYVVDAISKGWLNNWKRQNFNNRPNADLWNILWNLLQIHKVSPNWVKGHSGHPENETCDSIANRCAKGLFGQLIVDAVEVY